MAERERDDDEEQEDGRTKRVQIGVPEIGPNGSWRVGPTRIPREVIVRVEEQRAPEPDKATLEEADLVVKAAQHMREANFKEFFEEHMSKQEEEKIRKAAMAEPMPPRRSMVDLILARAEEASKLTRELLEDIGEDTDQEEEGDTETSTQAS